MPDFAYPNLFSPIRIGSRELPNRIVQSSLTSASSRGGQVSERQLHIYESRARGGAAMIVTEALAGHGQQQVGARVRAMEESSFDGLQRWAAAVERHGCRLLGQLMDSGRGRHHPGRNAHAIGASALPDDLSWTVPHALTVAEIRRMVEVFAATADRLKRAGFSGVELSCGHGHLFHQFLSPQSNRREDDYGGDLEGRTRLVRELCEAVRAACGADFILGIKLVGDDGVPGGVGPELSEQILARLGPLEPGYFAIAQGAHHRSLEMHVPDRTYPPAPYRHITRRMRRSANGIPIFAVGRITTPAEAEDMIASGDCDAVMLGRAFLADAAWVDKSRSGREAEIRLCINCNTCWEQTVGGHPVACDVNPRLGTADEIGWRPRPADRNRRIVVVGAGVAGLEAAWVAASRGHWVTLFGASALAGGKARLNARIPGCEQIARAYEFQCRAAREAGVGFELGEKAALEDVLSLSPDAVVLATGSRMRPPETWRSDRPVQDLRTVTERMLEGEPARRSGTAVLYDCDHTAGTYDAAELLADRFERLVIVTPRETIARDVGLVIRQRIYRRLSERRVELALLSDVVASRDGVVTVENVYNGDRRDIPDVALATFSTWREPVDDLAGDLRQAGIRTFVVGDCRAPRNMLFAIAEGHRAGNEL